MPVSRAYVRPEDTAAAFVRALDYEGPLFSLFNICASDSYSPIPSLEYARAVFGKLIEIRKPTWFERDPYASLIDNTSARQALGWNPTGRWEDVASLTLRSTHKWS
jgi:nucleoside-diphosphate-sugar epimerase